MDANPQQSRVFVLPELQTREEYFHYLEGYSVERAEELAERRTRRPLVKTFLLETLHNEQRFPGLKFVFHRAGFGLDPVDEALLRVREIESGQTWALVEQLDRRHPVIYTLTESQEASRRVRSIIQSSPWLDSVWLSAPIFEELWRHVRHVTPPWRFSKLSFEYEARYESEFPDRQDDLGMTESDDDEAREGGVWGSDRDLLEEAAPERRASKCTLVERVGEISSKLSRLQDVYQPFYSITSLRLPAPTKGGHDFYFDGRVTNRSDSFTDHRQQVAFVLGLYGRSTSAAEKALWMSLEQATDAVTETYRLHGAPLVLQFRQPLPGGVFRRWIEAVFGRRNNRFRLWGHPIWLSASQVHVYGVDRHLWQPVYLDLTTSYIVAILPKGTCGNTVHRLVTNVQRFLDPGVKAWIGGEEYQQVLADARG